MTRRELFGWLAFGTACTVSVAGIGAAVVQVVRDAPERPEIELADPFISYDPTEPPAPKVVAIAADRLEPGDLVAVTWRPYSPIPVARRAEERGDL